MTEPVQLMKQRADIVEAKLKNIPASNSDQTLVDPVITNATTSDDDSITSAPKITVETKFIEQGTPRTCSQKYFFPTNLDNPQDEVLVCEKEEQTLQNKTFKNTTIGDSMLHTIDTDGIIRSLSLPTKNATVATTGDIADAFASYLTTERSDEIFEQIMSFIHHMKKATGIDCRNKFQRSTATTIDLNALEEKIDMSRVYDASYMFNGCANLESLPNHDEWDLNFLEIADYMFSGCSSLTELNARNWGLGSLRVAASMFQGCENLTNLGGFELSNVHLTQSCGMFKNCSKLRTLIFGQSFDMTRIMNCYRMFEGCSQLETLSGLNEWGMSYVKDAQSMFANCSNITELDLSGWNLLRCKYIMNMFLNCSKLTTLYLDNWKLPESLSCSNLFSGCSSLTTIFINGAAIKRFLTYSYSPMSIAESESLQNDTIYECSGSVNTSGVFVISGVEEYED